MISGDDNSTLNFRSIQRRFDRAAAGFDAADFVHALARDGLMARLEPITVEPRIIVDLGAATGAVSRLLAKRYRRAHVIAVDLSRNMLEQVRSKRSWFSKISVAQADARRLPFLDGGVDLVFANLLLPWIDDHSSVFHEVGRILKENGLFLFSTLGPDSLLNLRRAWQSVDSHAHVNRFLDMHDIGDALVSAGLRDPVLDVDRLTVTYADTDALFRDLTAVGARNSLANRNASLVSRSRFRAMTAGLEALNEGERIKLDLELIYGHCWWSGPRSARGEVRIEATNIGHRRR